VEAAELSIPGIGRPAPKTRDYKGVGIVFGEAMARSHTISASKIPKNSPWGSVPDSGLRLYAQRAH